MTTDLKAFLLRGLAAGAAGGVAAALFLRVVTERQFDLALRFEDATGLGAAPGEAPLFDRPSQQWGGMAAAVIYGLVFGLVLAVAVAALHHRVRATNEFGRVAKVAVGIFVATSVIPMLKYPPNPPGVGDPDTIGQRTGSFLSLMAASVVLVFLAALIWQALTDRGIVGADRFLAAGAACGVLLAVVLLVWPASTDRVAPRVNEAVPTLRIADDADPAVLDRVLATARTTDSEWLRDPDDPSEPLDLTTVRSSADLAGVPVAVSTTELVSASFTNVVWHFRVLTVTGLALYWAVTAGVLGALLDRRPAVGRAAG